MNQEAVVEAEGTIGPAFPPEEYQRRIAKLRELMAEQDLRGVLLSEPAAVNYYTGYDTLGFWNFQLLVVSSEGERCIVCFFEEVPSVERAGCSARGFAFGADPIAAVCDALIDLGIDSTRLGIEEHSRYLPPAALRELAERQPGVTYIDISTAVTDLRLIKSEAEISYVREAASITSRAMQAGLNSLAIDGIDRTTAATMYSSAINLGSEYFSIPPIVKFGPTMTEGHLTWRGLQLRRGNGVNLEIAAVRKRYHAPMLRCAFAGEPSSEVVEAMEVALAGLAGALQAICPGVTGDEVDAASIEAVKGTTFRFQPAGYSVGVAFPPSWMEAHLLAAGNTRPLEAGMTLHVVPCVLLPGLAHVGASETVLVTDAGIEILTDCSREMVVV